MPEFLQHLDSDRDKDRFTLSIGRAMIAVVVLGLLLNFALMPLRSDRLLQTAYHAQTAVVAQAKVERLERRERRLRARYKNTDESDRRIHVFRGEGDRPWVADMGYEFQLVLRIPEDSPVPSYRLEDSIAEVVGNPCGDPGEPHAVEGYSSGDDTTDFFIHTNDPRAAFELTKPLLASAGLLGSVTARYRRFSEDACHVIWPIGFIDDPCP
jgi:hypothetical protein